MRFLGFLFTGLIAGSLLVWLNFILPGSFLNNFLDSGLLETFAALAGFNLAAVIFLLGQLMEIEQKVGGVDIFITSKKEIKQNAYFLLGSFTLCFVLLVIRPGFITETVYTQHDALNNHIYYGFNVAIVTLFILGIYAIFEILQAVFKLSNLSRQE